MTVRPIGSAVVALAALVAAGCGGGPAATGAPSPPTFPPPRSVGVTGSGRSASPAPLTAEPPPGTRVLHSLVRGSGSRQIGQVYVPRRYAVVVACVGPGELVVVIESAPALGIACGSEPDEVVNVEDRPRGVRAVRVSIRADSAVRWAVVVTSDPKVSS